MLRKLWFVPYSLFELTALKWNAMPSITKVELDLTLDIDIYET